MSWRHGGKMKLLKKMYLCTLACLFLSNCGEEVRFKKIPDAPIPPTVNPTPPPIQAQKVEEDFIQSDTEGSADILFVVDNSGSMFNEQEKVGEKINSMISKIQKIDWQIGITTTDVSNGPHGIKGDLLNFPDGSKILSPSSTEIVNQFVATVERDETLDCYNGSDNPCPSRDEQPLLATMMALSKADSNNAGFFRQNSHFVLIVLSDEDELSTGPDFATKPQEVVQLVQNTLGLTKKFISFGIIIEPGDTNCFDQEVYGEYGTFVSELASLTNGSTTSICEDDYGEGLKSIGDQVRQLVDSIELRDYPEKESIEIKLEPDFETQGFQVSGKKILLNRKPPKGTKISVRYRPKTN